MVGLEWPAWTWASKGVDTLLLNPGQILATERVPAEPREVESKTLGCRADEVLENGAVIKRVSVLLKHIPVSFDIGRLVVPVSFHQASQRKISPCTLGISNFFIFRNACVTRAILT